MDPKCLEALQTAMTDLRAMQAAETAHRREKAAHDEQGRKVQDAAKALDKAHAKALLSAKEAHGHLAALIGPQRQSEGPQKAPEKGSAKPRGESSEE